MYISQYYLKSTIESLDKFIKKINVDNNINFDINKEKILYYLHKTFKYIEDIELYFNDSISFINYTKSTDILNIINKINDITIETKSSNKEIYDIISEFLVTDLMEMKSFYVSYIDKKISDKIYYRKNELSINKINLISSCIKNQDRNILYLNPCCFSNMDDPMLKSMIENLKMYCIVSDNCIEESEEFRNFNEKIYEKFIIENSLSINDSSVKKNIRISNGVFDILNIQPEVSINIILRDNIYAYPSKEFSALKDNIKFLRKDGIIFYTIPYTRFTYEIALYISKNFKNINIIRSNDDYEKRITIIGQKALVKDYQETYNILKQLNYNTIPTSFNYEYELPEEEKVVDLFRGGIINEKEITKIILSDNLYNDFFNEINNTSILTDTKPLLPFNVGQVGLILTSGRLDGVIDEPGNNKHIIKGRTIKYTEQITNNDYDDAPPSEKISNKVQINAFDGEGNFVVIN